MPDIVRVTPKIGMEVHVELSTRRKMFTRVASPAFAGHEDAEPNTLIDPVTLGLPGALPVMNREAIERSMLVGMALGCSIARYTKWDRKGYFYPDLPKAYQISQYDLPLCFDGAVTWPIEDDGTSVRIGIARAHLEEDAGKLLHDWPGGKAIDYSIVDLNRAGTPLLEIVTAPDFTSAEQCVNFSQMLRNVCRWLGASEGDMQKGHMRFEPNINCVLELEDGRTVATPIVEVKNLNSFKSLRGAIEHELKKQPERWKDDGLVMGPGAKTTRGWDDAKSVTFVQREKEDAHDYRYFPDPDLPPVRVDEAWEARVRERLPELPHERAQRYEREFGIGAKEANALVSERATCVYFEDAVARASSSDAIAREQAGKKVANLILQAGFKRANETGMPVEELGIDAEQLAGIAALRARGDISAAGADELFGALCETDEDAATAADRLGLVQVRDEGQLEAWVKETIEDPANAKSVEDFAGGKDATVGRLVGDVMKRSQGQADAKAVREMIVKVVRG
ncbi:MAG: Asp-tRNA(Asn)/Glu-tRNA(Gln) amidotransferase subunit GatB [Planctomycetota bacterium]